MKILFLDSPAFAKQDMIDAFEANQITCDLFYHKDYKERHSKEFEVIRSQIPVECSAFLHASKLTQCYSKERILRH